MNLGHNNSSQRSFMGDDMMAMKRCRYISSTEKELFVGTGTTCLVLYSSETHRIQVLHDIEAVYPRAHTMDIDPGNWNCDSFLNELSLRRINNRSVEIFVLLQYCLRCRVMRIYKISPDSFIFLIQVQFFPSYYLFKTIKFPIFNFFIYHSAFSLHYLVLKF